MKELDRKYILQQVETKNTKENTKKQKPKSADCSPGRGLRGTGDKREALPLFLSADAGC